jgi:hypothetical protein
MYAVVVVLLVSGCQASEPPSSPSDTPSPCNQAPLPGATLGPAKLHYGEQAVETIGCDDERSLLGIAVTGITRGTAEDAAALRAEWSGYQGDGPLYFIDYTLTNVDGKPKGDIEIPELKGLVGGQNVGEIDSLGIDWHLPHCTSSRSLGATQGARLTSCKIIYGLPDEVRLQTSSAQIIWT